MWIGIFFQINNDISNRSTNSACCLLSDPLCMASHLKKWNETCKRRNIHTYNSTLMFTLVNFGFIYNIGLAVSCKCLVSKHINHSLSFDLQMIEHNTNTVLKIMIYLTTFQFFQNFWLWIFTIAHSFFSYILTKAHLRLSDVVFSRWVPPLWNFFLHWI